MTATTMLKTIIVPMVQFHASRAIDRGELLKCRTDVRFYEDFSGRLVADLCAFLGADKLVDLHVEYPRDWWEAVKERFAPAWALRRWPVRKIAHTYVCHDIPKNLPIPDHYGPTIRIAEHHSYGVSL